MTNLELTQHAQTRFSQRSLDPKDLTILLRVGSETHEGFMVLERDYQAFERDVKRLLKKLKRLFGKRIIVENGRVVTGYKCTKRTEKNLIRQSKEKGVSLC